MEVSREDVALYLLIAISLTLRLVPQFAGGERERREEVTMLYVNRGIQGRRGQLAARGILLGMGCSPQGSLIP